jgi:hypothetical protein
MLVAARTLDRFALARAAGFRVYEPLRVSSPGMTKGGRAVMGEGGFRHPFSSASGHFRLSASQSSGAT